MIGQTHGLEMVPHYTERATSPVQQPRTGRPGYESGMSSPRFAGGIRDDNLHNEATDDQEYVAGHVCPDECGLNVVRMF